MGGVPSTTLLDSITDADASTAGTVVLCGSHGGVYPAAVASQARARAAIFNDAGIGYQSAGIAGVIALASVGLAAASVACMSCEIGSAADTRDNGRISFVNAPAQALGVEAGQTAIEAARLLEKAPIPEEHLEKPVETWATVPLGADGTDVHLLDSAALIGPRDAGQIVITGSHGGLVGGDPQRALKVDARVAVFNDAGVGKNGIGVMRLPALDQRGVAAVTVSHETARIGDAASIFETGVLSATNRSAAALGAREGQPLYDWLITLA